MKRRSIKVEMWFDGNRPVMIQRDGWADVIEEVMERWDVRGRWWARDTQRHYMIVRTERGAYELCGDRNSRSWLITATYD